MSTTTEQDLGNIDLADPALWDAGPPYDLFARMQREARVHFSPQRVAPDEGGFWSITRHEDVRAVSRDFKTFSSERRGILNVDDVGVPLVVARTQMISMDPPRNTTGNVWEWCSDWFSPDFHTRDRRTNPEGPRRGTHRTTRGGSYLCHESYCLRYRVSARNALTPDTSTGNVGFRGVRSLTDPPR